MTETQTTSKNVENSLPNAGTRQLHRVNSIIQTPCHRTY